MKQKFEKFVYPLMMGLCLLSSFASYMSGQDYTWPLITFSWVAIAWGNSKNN